MGGRVLRRQRAFAASTIEHMCVVSETFGP